MSRLSILIALILLLFTRAGDVLAQDDFITDSRVVYVIDELGNTKINHHTSITNISSEKYVTSYTYTLNGVKPLSIKAYDNKGAIDTEIIEEEESIVVNMFFDDAVVGKDNFRNFTLSYEVDDIAAKTGEVWEIIIPKMIEVGGYRNLEIEVQVPNSFGKESYISPKFNRKGADQTSRVYTFDKSVISESALSMGFGDFQVFSFTLKYHLDNPLKSKAKTEIPIPPDTPFQKVYLSSISPKPESIYVDNDDNWIATYELSPRERVDINVIGSVQLFSSPWKDFNRVLDYTSNTSETNYWQSKSPDIIELSTSLDTPRDIYNYVAENLDYDYERVKPNVERLGSIGALKNPGSAICMEFTDLFIALSRAKGIPAREVNGFAYSENPELQPLSLVADVLHAWPEYWDSENMLWIPVDPTWASTTNGGNYFDKLDLRHFTFVHHGSDPSKPYPPGSYKLGENPQKDVFVNFGRLPENRENNIEINAKYQQGWPIAKGKALVEIINNGPLAVYDTNSIVSFDKKNIDGKYHDVILPFTSVIYEVESDAGVFGINSPTIAGVNFGDNLIEVDTNKQIILIYNSIAIFLLLFVISTILLIKIKKISIKKLVNNAVRRSKV